MVLPSQHTMLNPIPRGGRNQNLTRMTNFLVAKFLGGKISFCAKYSYDQKKLFAKISFWQTFFSNFFWRNFFGGKIFFCWIFRQISLWWMEYLQYCPRDLPLKFGQNWASDSWDIPVMDKWRKGKCCMEKCPFDNCLRLSRVNG